MDRSHYQLRGVVGDVPEKNGWGEGGPLDSYAEIYVTDQTVSRRHI